jgi:ATP-binding cassette subfamily B protein
VPRRNNSEPSWCPRKAARAPVNAVDAIRRELDVALARMSRGQRANQRAIRVSSCPRLVRAWTARGALARGVGVTGPGLSEFARSANGVGEFSVTGARRYDVSSAPRWILSHLGRYWPLELLFIGFAIVGVIAYSFASIVTGRMAEEMLKPDGGRLLALALELFGMLCLNGLANLVSSFSAENISKGLQADAREELYVSLLSKSQTFHGRQRVGDIMARVTEDVQMLGMMVTPGIRMIVESLLSIVVPCAFLAALAPELLIVPAIFLVCYGFALLAYMRALVPVMMQQRSQYGRLNAGLEETVSGIEVVKASAREGFEREKYGRVSRELRDTSIAQGVIEARYLPLLLFAIATGAIFMHCLWLHERGVLRLSEIIAAMGLFSVLRFPTFISIFTFSLLQAGLAGAARILGIIRSETELEQNATGHATTLSGRIEFEDVSFAYGERQANVLDHVSFRVEPGRTVAIVGQTGSGKSTLTQLVNRIYDPSSGRVLIDGVDTRAWSLHALRSGIGKIEQDIFLFSRSIADNIAFARPGATRAEVEQAAKDASAHEFISELPSGYDTTIGQRGVTLSGGQRQRIALARAFLSDPRILILDDSTSAIDSATEEQIQRALRRVQAGRTTLLITHRLSMIRWADVILVLDRGRLVATGDHHRLLRTSPVYRRIFARYDLDLPPLEAAS